MLLNRTGPGRETTLEAEAMSTTSSQNPDHLLSEPVQQALDDLRAKRLEALASQQQMAAEVRPNEAERQEHRKILMDTFRFDPDTVRDVESRRSDRIRKSLVWTDVVPELAPMDFTLAAGSADFWWAQTNWFFGGGLGVQDQTDGLHFFGRVGYNADPLISFSTGAWATFELQPERRPHSPSGRWNSAPYVELFGNIVGWTNIYHWLWAADDKWCKCRLFLRQSAIQFVDDAGTWRLCGENTSLRTLIDEENNGRSVTAPLPGYLPMPFLQFGLLRPDRSVFIDLEVRFDIQLEGDSFIGFSPGQDPANSVLLRYFQWPCLPA